MNVNKLLHYKVIEAPLFMGIIPHDGQVRDARNLMLGDMQTCGQYLVRYTEHRANGKTIEEAHQLALRGANVVEKLT